MNNDHQTDKNQEGAAVLLVSILLLSIMTVALISAYNISAVQFRIIGNMQMQRTVESAAQEGVERVISSSDDFSSDSTEQNYSIGGNTVTVAAPECIASVKLSGYSATWGLAPEDNTWHVQASVTDSASGARAIIHQGIRIRMRAGQCP
ncbi:hypothetical protein ACQZV8_12825 [Magnetococcales bacterium HHB-1]